VAAVVEGFEEFDGLGGFGEAGEAEDLWDGGAQGAGDGCRGLGGVEVEFEEGVEVDGWGVCVHEGKVEGLEREARGARGGVRRPLPTCCQFAKKI
jgi:hypothetical protein